MKSSVQALCMSVVFEQLGEPIQLETGGVFEAVIFVRRAMKMMNAELERWELHVLFIHDRMPRVWNRQQTAIACRSKMIKYENLPVHAADHSNLAERCHTVILFGTSCVEILELRPWQGKMQRKRWFSFTLFDTEMNKRSRRSDR